MPNRPKPIRVKVDFSPLNKFRSQMKRDLRRSSDGPVRRGLRQVATRYMGFVRTLFVKRSQGNGEWEPLKPSTVKRRRKGGKKRGGNNSPTVNQAATGGSVAILRDTSTLFSALGAQSKASLKQDTVNGVMVGIKDGVQHKSGNATIADIARYHHLGSGDLPERKIFEDPDKQTTQAMVEIMGRAARKLMKDSQ